MNLQATIALYGGGPGSGCNPAVGKCGRHFGGGVGTWNPKTNESTKDFYLDNDEHYIPQRAELHDQLIQKYQNKTSHPHPILTVLVGGTASGKSTYDIKESAKLRDPTIIDVDKMRADLPEFNQVAGTPGSELVLDEARDVRDAVMMSALAHNNDIALEAVGHPDTPAKIDEIEKAGYQVRIVYVHRPAEESVQLATKRATDSPTMSGRIRPSDETIRQNHMQTRAILAPLMKPGREVTVYDGAGDFDINKPYEMSYHRGADGKVDTRDDAALEKMRNGENPPIPNIF